MRPMYETPEDLKNEKDVANYLSGLYGCDFVKLKISYGLDFAIVKNSLMVATAEIKCRNYTSAQIDNWGGLMLSATKAHRAHEWFLVHRIPFLLIAKLKDGIFVANIGDWGAYRIEMTGRTDRNDWQDIEPCCIIPMNNFDRVTNDQTP